MKTPQTASRIYPSLSEMHPSKIHQSTTKSTEGRGPKSSHTVNEMAFPKPTVQMIKQDTPSKSKGSLPGHMSSPSFDFSFERPKTSLSEEAQKIMESVREEAARIKAEMEKEKDMQERKDGETNQLYGVGGRKLAKPKGKSGRYSDVHKEQFKKMDSIANHASAWKNKLQPNTSSLKRSPSKAGLYEPVQQSLSRSKSFKAFHVGISDRFENTSPGKRAKHSSCDDTSAARPVSRDSEPASAPGTPSKLQNRTGLPSAVTTPTKASLARSASVKQLKGSMPPSLSRSASTKTLRSPALIMPRTEGSNRYLSSLSKLGSNLSGMKSILHRAQPKFSDDLAKVAAGTHLPLPKAAMDLEKELPNLPSSPAVELECSPTIKRVNFTPSTKSTYDLAAAPPSLSKIPTRHINPQAASIQQPRSLSPTQASSSDPVTYPLLANSPNITTRTKFPKASAPGDFTFRSARAMDFPPNTSSITPNKSSCLTSPNSTIRYVRPSGISTPLPSYESIPHGMPNKKRRRPELDIEAEENENPNHMSMDEDDEEPRTKKQRMTALPEKVIDPQKRRLGGSRIPKTGGKGEKKGLSLGRLNVLARPKERR